MLFSLFIQWFGCCLRAGLRAASLSTETKDKAGDKSSIPDFRTLVSRPQVGNSHLVHFCPFSRVSSILNKVQ
jgi:hypothetical protein